MFEFEEKKEFYFDVGDGKKENSILVRIHGWGLPCDPHPEILIDLLKRLEAEEEEILSLREKFPQYSHILLALAKVLSLDKIIVIKKEKCELHYSQIDGYSIHLRVEFPATAQTEKPCQNSDKGKT